jgi:predicted ATPase/class 3 adenylate cyclase
MHIDLQTAHASMQLIHTLAVYLPTDRYQAMVRGETLPERMQGAGLLADISGFTPLTEALAREFGPQRGAEELTRQLNNVYETLISELHRFGGSVIGFSGDAITCWFDSDLDCIRATACALAMQEAMRRFAEVLIPGGQKISLAMKVAIAGGTTRRFLVGDPQIQVIDVITGTILDQLSAAEHLAQKGEVVLDQSAVVALGDRVSLSGWRQNCEDCQPAGVVERLNVPVLNTPWPSIPPAAISLEQIRPWLLPAVYERIVQGQGDFLAEIRPVVAFFLHFSGIDYEADGQAGLKLDAYVRHVQKMVHKYDGNIIQVTIGDKGSYLYAAFGAPIAHEDDAERAASAALELLYPPRELSFISQVQIGISRGRTRAGAYGGSMRRTYGVQGDDVNLAARLMMAAAPGQALVSQKVRLATGEAFRWEEQAPLRVKGKSEPVITFRLAGLREKNAIRLQEPGYSLPMVGRARELALIGDKLDQALKGHGQVIGISGEAGIGKSRLVAEAIRQANGRGLVGYGSECQSYGTNTSYLVWQSIWQSFFNIQAPQSLEEKSLVLASQLARISPLLVPRMPLLGPVLNLTLPDNDLTRSFDAKLRKASLEALLVDCLRLRSRENPIFLVLEDSHWLDPLSHDLLDEISRAIADLPVLILMTYRPPDKSYSQGQRLSRLPCFTEIPLNEFTPQESEQLIRSKLARATGQSNEIPEALVEHLTQRAQGNPFYIEELLNYFQDRGLSLSSNATTLTAIKQLDLPTSLHSLILARIDQCTESQKTTIKLASVIGRLFVAAWLWGAFPQVEDRNVVRENLQVLSRMDLTVLDVPEPELAYLFRHVVTQEVAYESLPFSTRQELHGALGQFIEHAYTGSIDQYVDLLAYHYERSLNQAKKREYLLKAGDLAQSRYANETAIGYYQRVLEQLPAMEQIGVRRKLGSVLGLVGRWQEAEEQLREAMRLAEEAGDRLSSAWCRTEIAELLRKQSSYAQASDYLQQAQAMFESLGYSAGVGQVLHFAGTLAVQQGHHLEARRLYERSLEIRRQLGDRAQIANLLNNLGIIARQQGDSESALKMHREALELRRELGDRGAISVSLSNLGNVALDIQDYALARTWLEEALALMREIGDRYNSAITANNLANVLRAQGEYQKAHLLYVESLEISKSLGAKWAIAYVLEDIGCLSAREGNAWRALCLAGAAARLRQEIGSPLSANEQARLDATLAEARLSLSKDEQATAWEAGMKMPLEKAVYYALLSRK